MLRFVDDLMPIGEFSERSGLSAKRLRTYAAAGLLTPTAVDPGSGYRYYSPGQLREARLLDVLRDAGMPLAEIGGFLRDPSGRHLDAWARQVDTDAAARRRALDQARELLAVEAESSTSVDNHGEARELMAKLRTASRIEIGNLRADNEDAVVGTDRLVVVADGMGGPPGGEVASAVAVSLVEAAFTGASLDELGAAVRAANRAIWDRAGASAELEGMGTTVCALGLVGGASLAVVNVGDSRAYLWRDGVLTRLTEDHTVTAEAVRRGELSEQEALGHPHRSVLTRALGVGPGIELDSSLHPVADGDRFLLCSDGLFHEVSDDEIATVLEAGADLDATAGALVDLALSHGGRDNITAAVAEVRV